MSQTSNLKEKINGVKQELESINNKLLLQQETQDLDLKDILEIEKMFLDGEIIIDFIPILEALIKQKYNSNMNKILNRLKLKKADFLLEKLRTEGYKLSQNKDFKEAVNKSIYRLLNFIRLGKRDDVTGILMQIFASKNISVPRELIMVLKYGEYEDNLFKAFMYAFLSNFMEVKGNE